jgi:hypothetical protein
MESLDFLDSLLPREEPQNQLASMEHLPFLDSLLPCDEPREHTSLGSLKKIPLEIRDIIYDLCVQKKQYEIEQLCGPLRFQVHAPLSHCRLISKTFSREYQARAPANALLILGKFRGGYTFQLGDSATKHIQDSQNVPTPRDCKDTVAQYGDLKITPFEVAGLRCSIPSPPHVLVNRMLTTPVGSFGLDLRFYQDPRSDLLGFLRVFDAFLAGWTPGSSRLRVGPGALQLHDVKILLKGDWSSHYYRRELPMVGTWTSKGGFAFDKVADGIRLGNGESGDDTGVERHDTGL